MNEREEDPIAVDLARQSAFYAEHDRTVDAEPDDDDDDDEPYYAGADPDMAHKDDAFDAMEDDE